MEATCLIGTADDVAERLLALEAAGLYQVMILPSFAPCEPSAMVG